MPEWLVFDESRLIFSGTPKAKDITFNSNKSEFYQIFKIVVTASDIGDLSVSSNFSLIVKNTLPKINTTKSLQKQFEMLQPIINYVTEFQFDPSVFISEDNSSLTFEARLWGAHASSGRLLMENPNDTTTLPNWIKFDTNQRRFTIQPPENTVNQGYKVVVYASNGLQQNSDSFSFTVGYSFEYVFAIFLKILSPILGAIGIIAYRIALYDIFFKTRYKYPKIERIPVFEESQQTDFLDQ